MGDVLHSALSLSLTKPLPRKFSFTDRGQQGTSSTCSFTAVSARSPGDDAGFVGVAANKQHFAFRDSGATYMGVGENVAWVSSKQTYDYDEVKGMMVVQRARKPTPTPHSLCHTHTQYFGALAKAGANYARLWLTDSWVGTFIETKLGEYSMENSWNLDYIVALAERLGLRLMLTTESFNFLCHFKGGACFFPQFVYVHAHTHSMTSHTTPILIATPTPAAAQLQPGQRRPHQHTTRVLYQPHGARLLQAATAVPRVSIRALSECAELGVLQRGMRQHATGWLSAERDLSRVGNQVDITEGYNSTAQHQWNSEMAKYLKSIDHYGHMITTSMCCHKPDPAVYSIPELDHVAYHSCECLTGPAPLLPSGGS